MTYLKYWLNLNDFLRGTEAKQNKRCQELKAKVSRNVILLRVLQFDFVSIFTFVPSK